MKFFNKGSKNNLILILSPVILFIIFILFLFFDDDTLLIAHYLRNKDDVSYEDETVIEYREVDKKNVGNNVTNGTGLNLLLINNIKTEGYVKEMLSMYRDSAEGKISDYSVHASVGTLLGMQCNETGTYQLNGTDLPIPKSYIPIVNNEIHWGKDFNGISGDLMKLNKINHNVINTLQPESPSCNNYNPSYLPSKLPYNINYLNPKYILGDDAWRDINAFQVRYKYFGLYGGSQKPSKLNGHDESDGRKSDPYFLPDNLANIDAQLVDYCDRTGVSYDVAKNSDVQSTILSVCHNAGQYAMMWDTTFGAFGKGNDWQYIINPSSNKEVKKEYEKATLEVVDSFSKCFKDVRGIRFSAPSDKVATILLLMDDGWKINESAYNYIVNSCSSSCLESTYKIVKKDSKSASEIRNLIKSAVSEFPFSSDDCKKVYGYTKGSNMKSIGGSIFKVENRTSIAYKNKMSDGSIPKVVHRMPYLSAAHVLSSMCGGDYVYAAMLKYAGVDVDPTNPDTYINSIPSNEWKPSGGDWLAKEGVDTNSLSLKRVDLLNFAYQYVGAPYAWGGTTLPKKDSKGKWIPTKRFFDYKGNPVYSGNYPLCYGSVDCSHFTYECMKHIGVSFPEAPTYNQRGKLISVSKDKVKPGDIFFNASTSHTGFFIKWDKDGYAVTLDARSTEEGIVYKRYSKNVYFYRPKGLD